MALFLTLVMNDDDDGSDVGEKVPLDVDSSSRPYNHCSAHFRGILQTRSRATSRGLTFKNGKH